MFRAKFPGKCTGGDRIRPGDMIVSVDGGYAHQACSANRKAVSVAAFVEDPGGDDAWWERRDAERERERMNAEYAAGIEDANRERFNRQMFGEAYAAAEEFARDMRGLNGEW